MYRITLLSLFLLIILIYGCSGPKVDLILHHGKIYTVDNLFTIAEAVAIHDGKIIATGTSDEILNRYSATSIINLDGRCVYPGFIDAHSHFFGYASDLLKCDVTGTKSFAEVLEKLQQFSKENKFEWLLGRGWDQNDWEIKEYPDNTALDSLFPEQPVFLMRIDGHAALCNTAALKRAKITASTIVNGGEIQVRNGKLTGILIDNAVELIKEVIPPFSEKLNSDALIKAQENCFRVGLTSVCDAGLGKDSIELIRQLQKKDLLKIRIYAMISDNENSKKYYFKKGPIQNERLTVRAIKMYADGALGSRGALLKQPYSDKPDHYGFLLHDIAYMNNLADEALEHGFQLCTHAIGDSAVKLMLAIYREHLHGPNNRRWRLEHCQVVDPNDLEDFKSLSVIPSVQPTHATSDMYWAQQRLGENRIQTAYCYKDLLKKSERFALGTDFPVEKIDPLLTFYAAVVRKDISGYPENGFLPENKIKRKDALRGMTIWAAYANFEDAKKGSIEAGKYADLVILDKDILECDSDELPETQVIATYIDGEQVYRK
jgi:predicted amidohydrolase YtcJ